MKNLLAKFLPAFLHKPGKPQPIQPAAPEPESSPTGKHPRLLDQISAFLARYLQCSPEQRTVLSLWILHTHCFSAAAATPYLAIQSSQKLSGKTLCLRLLSLLCSNPALTSGYTAAALVNRIHSQAGNPPTFLLDESPATVGSRRRPKSPKLHAILSCGFQLGIGYTDRAAERVIFSPKAFAITGKLPESLADRSIPIILKPVPGERSESIKDGPVSAGEKAGATTVERFNLFRARREAAPIVAAIQNWSKKNLSALKAMPAYKRQDFPPGLSARGEDIVEPLLHLAAALGDDCPAIARRALLAMFTDQEEQQRAESAQLLRAIYNAFAHHGFPDRIPTSGLLLWLNSLLDRPWDADGPINGAMLARLLRPCGIHPHLQRIGKASPARGYQKQDFAKVWSDAGVVPPPSAAQETKPSGSPLPSAATQQISSINAPCNTVTPAEIDPRLKGILADPRNYYRQYPEEHLRAMAHEVDRHYWPIPADDQNHPNAYGCVSTRDGYSAPLSCINQPPWNNDKPRPRSYPEKSPRFPVTFTRQERIQVAVARMHEIELAARAEKLRPLQVPLPSTSFQSATKENTSKNAACNAVTASEIDPRIKGLLCDPRNYYRQYPDEHKSWLKEHLNKQFWPQPADDEGDLHYLGALPGGSPIPFTLVDQPPRTTPHPSSSRFPVTLNEREKLQVALARLYEIRQLQEQNRARRGWQQSAKRAG